MKTVSTALAAHLAQECTTLATLVKLTRKDGEVLGFTSYDKDIIHEGVSFRAATAFTASALESRRSLSTDNLDIIGMLDDAGISEDDLSMGRYDHARVDVYLCNWADPGQGVMQLRRGWIGEITITNGTYQAELRGLTDLLQRTIGHSFTPECRHDLGNNACGISLAAHTVTGSVTVATSSDVFTDAARTEADGFFDYGLLTWSSGLNAGLSMEVKQFASGGVFQLWLPMPKALAVGDGYSVHQGCDRRFATCKGTFNNVANFGGFPHLPGVDRILTYPD